MVRLSCNFNRVPSIYGSSVGTDLHPVEFPARLHHGRSMSHVYVSRHIPWRPGGACLMPS